MRHYAVCPACNNPIQLIGFVKQAGEENLYARHVPKSILGVATYRQAAYDCCPLAAKNKIQSEKSAKKSADDDLAPQILRLIAEHFDRIILVLQESIGIFISPKLAGELLDDYLAEEAYNYKYASLLNIPWMLAYFSRSKSLVGRVFFHDDMKQAIPEHIPQAVFSGNQLGMRGKAFIKVNVYFSSHNIEPKGNTIEESMDMVITSEKRGQPSVVFRKKVIFDYKKFNHLLNIPEGKGQRNHALLDVATKTLSQHSLIKMQEQLCRDL